ncbi:SWIM zinc finger family protein [Streptomyces diacarni]|uniref:SWIM zinc finger family protein n=1 Tax=Streptomyces diacarni TaxID=2800381 RepID=UPI0033E313A3
MTTTTQASKPVVAHCLRCGRALRNATADGYGPKCRVMVRKAARAEVVAQYKPHQVAKAEELIEQGGLVPLRGCRVFYAVSSDGATAYKAHRAACTCPAGIKALYPCKHRIAAHILSLAA